MNRLRSISLVLFFFFSWLLAFSKEKNVEPLTLLPMEYSSLLESISVDGLGQSTFLYKIEDISSNMIRVELSCNLGEQEVEQDDWQIRLKPSFVASFNWAPHLTPTDKNIIAQHVFRSPVLIALNDEKGFAVIPDLDLLSQYSMNHW